MYSQNHTGYLRQIEMSFCMDECAEYYLETEYGEKNALNKLKGKIPFPK